MIRRHAQLFTLCEFDFDWLRLTQSKKLCCCGPRGRPRHAALRRRLISRPVSHGVLGPRPWFLLHKGVRNVSTSRVWGKNQVPGGRTRARRAQSDVNKGEAGEISATWCCFLSILVFVLRFCPMLLGSKRIREFMLCFEMCFSRANLVPSWKDEKREKQVNYFCFHFKSN